MRNEAIANFVKENPNPVQELCPVLCLRWKTVSGDVYWNSVHKVRSYNADYEFNASAYRTPAKEIRGAYARYIEELDAIELATIAVDGHRADNHERREWHYEKDFDLYYGKEAGRYFIVRGDLAVYNRDGEEVWVKDKGKYYNHTMLRFLNSDLQRVHAWANPNRDKLTNELTKFSETKTIMIYGGRTEIRPIWHFSRWYEKCFSKRIKKTTNIVDQYQHLPEIDVIIPFNAKAFVYQDIDENVAVIRGFRGMLEQERLYLPVKGKPAYAQAFDNEFRISTAHPCHWYYSEIANFINFDNVKEPLKYLLPVIKQDSYFLPNILNMLRHPVIESLVKAGYPKIAKELSYDNCVAANIQCYFGSKEKKGESLYKTLNVNKYILQLLESSDECRPQLEFVKFMKKLFGENLQNLSKETIDSMKVLLRDINAGYEKYCFLDTFTPNISYCNYTTYELSDTEKKGVMKVIRIANKEPQCRVINLFKDVVRTYASLDKKPNIDIYDFENYNGLVRMHNSLVELLNVQNRERNARYDERRRIQLEQETKKFNELQATRIEKFNAENEKFLIKVPGALSEITTEGLALNHCVGSYVSNHANGNTNILFLRKKGAEDTPWYTIEVANDKLIQIHGHNNKWLGNDPAAIPFVYQWLNNLGIKYDKGILLNTSVGYARKATYLPETALVG